MKSGPENAARSVVPRLQKAGERTRTSNLRLTKALLYQLSYTGLLAR
jgi:hypothetical protein